LVQHMGRELLLVWPQGLRRVRRGQCIEVWVTEIYLASYQNPVAALGPFHARDLLQVGAAAESLDCRLCGHDPQCLSPPGENVAHRAPTGFDQVVAWDVERLAEVFSSLYDATQQSPGLLPELWVGQKTILSGKGCCGTGNCRYTKICFNWCRVLPLVGSSKADELLQSRYKNSVEVLWERSLFWASNLLMYLLPSLWRFSQTTLLVVAFSLGVLSGLAPVAALISLRLHLLNTRCSGCLARCVRDLGLLHVLAGLDPSKVATLGMFKLGCHATVKVVSSTCVWNLLVSSGRAGLQHSTGIWKNRKKRPVVAPPQDSWLYVHHSALVELSDPCMFSLHHSHCCPTHIRVVDEKAESQVHHVGEGETSKRHVLPVDTPVGKLFLPPSVPIPSEARN